MGSKSATISALALACCLCGTGAMALAADAEPKSGEAQVQKDLALKETVAPPAKETEKTVGNAAGGGAKSPSDVLAKVNGTPITRLELDRTLKVLMAQQGQSPQDLPPELRKQAEESGLEQLISAELLYQKGVKTEVKDLDKKIEEKVAQGKALFEKPEEYEAALKANGLTEKDLKEIVRKDVIINNLFEKEIADRIKVSEADARKLYDENRDKLKKPEKFHASHILVAVDPQATPEEKKKAREKAQALRKKILAGADFAAVAKAESSCPSKENGGDLGTFSKGEMVPEFEAATQALKPGEISDVVETQFGYHIIKLFEKQEGGVASFDEVKEKLEGYLKQAKMQQVVQDYVKELRSKAKVEKTGLL